MYLAVRVLGYTSSFDVRDTNFFANEINPSPKLSSIDCDQQSIKSVDFRQIIRRVEKVIDY